jgi:sterol desaturase/sphingolipid hydroxylase (fatty acid hydroxylase superfamily)
MRLRWGAAFALGAAAGLIWLERRRPLRRAMEARARHDCRNLALASIAALTVGGLETPLVLPLAAAIERRRWGLLPRLGLTPAAERILGLLLLDYTLFLWHILTHRVPLIWRCHRMHHADLDLTATTALRFHAAELALSIPWRAAQVALIGVGPALLQLWQRLTLASILFHHANLRLPLALERRLALAIMTPRLHGIHHSERPDEMATNWSSGLTLWDRLHGTLRQDVPQDEIVIGLPGGRRPAAPRLSALLAMPLAPLVPAQAAPPRDPSSFPPRAGRGNSPGAALTLRA